MWSTCFMGRHCGWTCELSKRPSNICCIFGAGQNGTFLPFDILQQASTHLHGRSKYLSGVAVDWYSINIVFWNIFFFTKLAVTEGQGQIICSQKVGWVRDDFDLSYLRSPEVLTDVVAIKTEIRPQEDDNDWAKVFKSGIVHQGSDPTYPQSPGHLTIKGFSLIVTIKTESRPQEAWYDMKFKPLYHF